MNTRAAGILIAVLASLSMAAAAYTNAVVAAKMRPPQARVILYANGHPIAAMSDPPVLNFVYVMLGLLNETKNKIYDLNGNAVSDPIAPSTFSAPENRFEIILVTSDIQYEQNLITIPELEYIEIPVNHVQLITDTTSVQLIIEASTIIKENTTIYGIGLVLEQHIIRNLAERYYKVLIAYDKFTSPLDAKKGDLYTFKYVIGVG